MATRHPLGSSHAGPTYVAGLTLVELVVVLAVIAILMGAGFLGLLSWLGTDSVNVSQARLRSALQTVMADALTNPPASTTTNHNWSLQLVHQGANQYLYVCTGSQGGCAGNTNPANGPVEVHVSTLPTSVQLTINGKSWSCLALSPLGLPLLSSAQPAASNICFWPAAAGGQWTFQSATSGGSAVSTSYVF